MRFPQLLALLFFVCSNSAFAQCENGKCQIARKVASIPYSLIAPVGTRYEAVQMPVYHSTTSVVVSAAPVVVPAPIRVSSPPVVFNTPSFRSNGSGIDLATHLRTTHGVNVSGMSVAEMEARHRELHSGQRSFTVKRRITIFNR